MLGFGARRWASVTSGLFLAVAVVLVVNRSNFDSSIVNLQDVEEDSQIHDLQSKVSKLMADVREAGKDAEEDANKRDTLAMELASDHGYGHAVAAKPVLNPLRAEEIEDELKEEIASEDHDVKSAEKKRQALQRNLDKALNLLAKAQTKAFLKKEEEINERARKIELAKVAMKQAEGQKLASVSKKLAKGSSSHSAAKSGAGDVDTKTKIAALEQRVSALNTALAALRRLKQSAVAAGPDGEVYLAEIGQRLLAMPEVQQVLAQSLSAKDLTVAEKIAASLGKNFTANPPIDPKIMAEAVIATAEKAKGIPLLADAATPAVNTSSLLPPVDPALAAEAVQASKEVEIENKYKNKK